MEKQEQPRQHSLDNFVKWSQETIKKEKGDQKDEQEQKTVGLLHSRP